MGKNYQNDVAIRVRTSAIPTPISLASFEATLASDDAVWLEWETANELENLGFNLYRAKTAVGARQHLNGTLIPTQNPGSAMGATYSFVDQDVEANATYHYWLEDVGTTGLTTLHGPRTVTMPLYGRLRLIRPRLAPRPVFDRLR
jgi:hypothetical protein